MKKIRNNLLTTASLNVFTYLIPLVVTPYFLRIAGTENFALINIAQSIVQYLVLFVGYNLDASVAGEVAINKNDKQQLQRVYWLTSYARLVLLLVATLIYGFILLFFKINKQDVSLLNLNYLGLIGYAITPLWFYQGMEKFLELFLCVAFGKILFAVIVFTCIKHPADYWYYTLGLSLSQVVSGLLLFIYPLFKYKFAFVSVPLKEVIAFLKQKFLLFKGGTMVNFCMNINVTLLSTVLPLHDFGLYMAANKLMLVVFTLVTLPLNQSLYPSISRAVTENAALAIAKIKQLVVPGVTYMALAVCLGLFLFSKLLILLMLGDKFAEAEVLFRLMLFSLVANVLSNVVNLQLFIKLNLYKAYARITQSSAVAGVLITLLFAFLFGVKGAALAWLVSEFFLFSFSAYQLRLAGIYIFQGQALNPKAVVGYLASNKPLFFRKS